MQAFLEKPAFVSATGDADHVAAGALAELGDQRTHGSGGTRHHQRFARLGAPGFHEPEPRGAPGHSQHAERGCDRCRCRVQFLQFIGVRFVETLPAAVAQHPVANAETFAGGCLDLAHRAGTLHDPQRVGHIVGVAGRLLYAHVRIDADKTHLDQHFVCRNRRVERPGAQLIVLRTHASLGPPDVDPLGVAERRACHGPGNRVIPATGLSHASAPRMDRRARSRAALRRAARR